MPAGARPAVAAARVLRTSVPGAPQWAILHLHVAELAAACQDQRMLRMGSVVLGVSDMPRAVTFWTEALGYDVMKGGADARWTELGPAGESDAVLALQHSDVAPQEHPRVHLDLKADDAREQAAEVQRLVSLGAEQVDWDLYPPGPDFVVLADPDGNRFCIVDLSHT